MLTTKRVIGTILFSMPLIAAFVYLAAINGLMSAIISFTIAFLLPASVFLGLMLLLSEDENEQ